MGTLSPSTRIKLAFGQPGDKAMITENDLYAIGMESPTAWLKMEELCKALGIQYPPQYTKEKAISEPS